MATDIISPTDKGKAKRIAQELSREKFISFDSEGVNLSKDGPLTLVQIGTVDGRVYLFDVMINEYAQDKNFFRETGLDRILTSREIIKVIHSCSGDSAALYHQFGIRLQNVFDTQVAHLVIEEHKGRQLPSRLKLAEMCEQYSKHANVYEGKDDLKMKWSKRVGNFWAIRPMTDEMIQYASCDVTALIPEVYENQKKYITDNGLNMIYEDRIQEEIELDITPDMKERRQKRNNDRSEAILTNMDKNYQDTIDYASIIDPDEKRALEDTRFSELEAFSDMIKRLKQEYMISFMEELEQELLTPENFNPFRSVWYKLGEIERNGTETSKAKAVVLKQRLCDMVLKDIEAKYKSDTSLQCLATLDCQILKYIRPIGDQGQTFTRTIVSLHWKVTEKDLDGEIEKIKEDAEYDVRMSMGRLKFFINNDQVPPKIKAKAKALKDMVEGSVLRAIPVKYTAGSNIADLSDNTRAVLGTIQTGRQSYHPTVVALHWKMTYEKLCEDQQKLQRGEMRMNDGFQRKLRFLQSNSSVPGNVKAKAKEILPQTAGRRR